MDKKQQLEELTCLFGKTKLQEFFSGQDSKMSDAILEKIHKIEEVLGK